MHHFLKIVHLNKIASIVFAFIILLFYSSCNKNYRTPKKSISYFKVIYFIDNNLGETWEGFSSSHKLLYENAAKVIKGDKLPNIKRDSFLLELFKSPPSCIDLMKIDGRNTFILINNKIMRTMNNIKLDNSNMEYTRVSSDSCYIYGKGVENMDEAILLVKEKRKWLIAEQTLLDVNLTLLEMLWAFASEKERSDFFCYDGKVDIQLESIE